MPFILQTSGLSKKIGSKALVTDVNIHIPKGEIYGFLGPNGAGKTTVMKMITILFIILCTVQRFQKQQGRNMK